MRAKKKSIVKLKTSGVPLKYMGRWVAFVDDKPIAADRTLEKLMKKVQKAHLRKTPSIMLVPRKDEGPYVLIV